MEKSNLTGKSDTLEEIKIIEKGRNLSQHKILFLLIKKSRELLVSEFTSKKLGSCHSHPYPTAPSPPNAGRIENQ